VRELVRTSSPDILIVDAQSDGALAVCNELRRTGLRPRVILAGADGDEAWAVLALKAGARGILPKSATVENLLKAIRVVHQGEIWASSRVIALTVEELATHSINAERIESSLKDRISRRELEIVQLVATGLSNAEVGCHLSIAEPTVKAHLTHIFQKLALRDRGQLVAFYHRNGSPEPATFVSR
jgi:DNA-binding NarL/FixJ family response regulator